MDIKIKTALSWFLVTLFFLGSIALITIGVDHFMNHMRTVSISETNIKQITNNGFVDLFVDLDNGILYVKGAGGTLTVMENTDGTPKIWKDYKK